MIKYKSQDNFILNEAAYLSLSKYNFIWSYNIVIRKDFLYEFHLHQTHPQKNHQLNITENVIVV